MTFTIDLTKLGIDAVASYASNPLASYNRTIPERQLTRFSKLRANLLMTADTERTNSAGGQVRDGLFEFMKHW